MKRILILSFLTLTSITLLAQTKDVKVLVKGAIVWSSIPQAVVDKKTKKKIILWGNTENNSWHDNIGMVGNVPECKDFESLFPEAVDATLNKTTPYCSMCWQLTEEKTSGMDAETVLHCYFRMPADIVDNLWLASDECAILDTETGTIYRSRRTVPADCYGKVFTINGKEGTVLDFQIFFPKLPESTREIAIYGVPNWHMRGLEVSINRTFDAVGNFVPYDSIPQFHQPHLVAEAKDYDKDNHKTWAVFDDAHLIKPVKDGTLAIWRTPDATYLAEACEMNWMREYFGRGGKELLIDQSGRQYKCKGLLYYPNGVLFWNEGVTGDHFTIVRVFEPLPLDIETITLVVPESEPFAMWGANWSGKVETLSVKQLCQNRKLFEYHPRSLVE